MKLTNDDRAAFVRAVMDDVPEVDYRERATKIILDDVVPRLPAKVIACWKDKETRGFIVCNRGVHTPAGVVYAPPFEGPLSESAQKALGDLKKPHDLQVSGRRKLKSEVAALIKACSTLKQAQERLPEFAKYLPAERSPAPSLSPLVAANTVADLTKAGWPKGRKA